PELARALADPHALSPACEDEPDLGPEGDMRGVHYDDEVGMWVGPFIMGSINTRVVRRSNALQGRSYGPRFRYREVMGTVVREDATIASQPVPRPPLQILSLG